MKAYDKAVKKAFLKTIKAMEKQNKISRKLKKETDKATKILRRFNKAGRLSDATEVIIDEMGEHPVYQIWCPLFRDRVKPKICDGKCEGYRISPENNKLCDECKICMYNTEYEEES